MSQEETKRKTGLANQKYPRDNQSAPELIEKLKRSEKFLSSALNGIQDPVNIVDRDYRVIFANEASAQLTGSKVEDLQQTECYRARFGRTEPCDSCVTPAAFETGERQRAERWDVLNGVKVYLELHAFPILDEHGRVEYVLEYAKDITDRKRLEDEREQQRKELGRRIRETRQAYEELESLQRQVLQAEKMGSIGQMASSLAHEIDTPLSTISGYCELLSDVIQDEGVLDKIQIISEQAERCKQTIRRMLSFARKSDLERTTQDVNALIKKTCSLLEHILKVKTVNVELNLDEGLPHVNANENELQQVFLNLIMNAADAMPKGGQICVKTCHDVTDADIGKGAMKNDNSIGIVFEDDGPGIAEDHLSVIFEPFFSTKEAKKGTGLGLAVCTAIIKAHGGEITAENRSGNGARFLITLPAKS